MGWRDGIPLETADAEQRATGWRSGIPVSVEQPQGQPRVASGPLEALQAGYQGSATGLLLRGKLPDIVLDGASAKWYEKALASVGQMGAELPEMIGGAALGGAAGTAAAGPVGAILGGGAGTFAVPAAIRQSLIEAYKSGTVDSSGGFLNSVGIILKQTAKEAAVGAATFGVGGAVARGVGKAIAPAIGESITAATGMRAIGAAGTAAEVGTMVVTPAALDGHLPEWSDFVNAAIVVGAAKGAMGLAAPAVRATANKLGDIYARTGIRPEQVIADSKNNPEIAADLTGAKVEPQTGVPTWDTLQPGQTIRLFRGESEANDANGQWWTTDRAKAEKYGTVTEVVLPAEVIGKNAARGHGGADEFVFPNTRPTDLAVSSKPGESEIPRAYQPAAEAELLRNALPEAPKVAEIIANPRGTLTDGKEPNHINYRYVEAPEDVVTLRAKIAETMKSEIEDARGKESWDKTQAKAEAVIKNRLAGMTDVQKAELSKMSFSDLAAQSMAVEAMAQKAAYDARTAAADIAAKGADAKPEDHAKLVAAIETSALLHQIDQANGAEVARALNARKAATQRAALAEGMGDMLSQYGGDPHLLARMVLGLHSTEAMTRFASNAAKATKWEMVVEAWKAGILSGPVTHMANIIGNSTFVAMRPLIDLTAAAIGKMTGRAEQVSMAEPFARVFGNLQGTKDAFKLAGEAMSAAYEEGGIKGLAKEIAVGSETQGPQKVEQFRKAIPGTVGDVIRLPFRLLSVADEFFKTMNERGEAYALATRQAINEGFNVGTREFREKVVDLVQNDVAIAVEAKGAALRYTFNMPLGEKGQAVSDLVRKAHLEMFVPFIRTPGNILKELTRMTPLAPVIGEWRSAIAEGGAKGAQAAAELGVGTAIMGVVASYAMDSSVSGQGSPDSGKQRVARAAGWQPYSIKVGDTWYNYQRLQPVGTLMGLAADMAEVWDHMTDEEMDKVPKMISVAFANAVTNQTFLQGITNIVNAMSDPKRFGPRLAQQMAGSVVPALIAQPTQMADPYVRQVDSMLDAIRARIPSAIPGGRDSLMAKRDVFGQEISTKSRLGGISPVTETTVSTDLVRTEAERIGFSTADAPKKVHLGRGTGKYGDVEITPEDQNKFTEISGQKAHDILEPIVTSANWAALPDLVQKRIYAKAFTIAHKQAAAQIFSIEERRSLIGQITENVRQELRP